MRTLRETQSDNLNGVVWKVAEDLQQGVEINEEQPPVIILGDLLEWHERPVFELSRYISRYDMEPLGQAFANTFSLIKSSEFQTEVCGLDFDSVCEVILDYLVKVFCPSLKYHPAADILTLIADVLTYAVNKGLFVFPEG